MKIVKNLVIAAIMILLVVVFYLYWVSVHAKPADAFSFPQENICICHNVKHNPVTVCANRNSILEGHGRHLRDGKDTWGECEVPEVTDQCSNIEGVQETVPQGMEQEKTEDGLICSPVPVPTPKVLCEDSTALNFQSEGTCRFPGPASAPQAPACEAPVWAPTLNFDGKEFSWTTVKDGVHTYWLRYGPAKDDLRYEVVVSGEKFLPNVDWKGQIWASVAGYDNGCTGPFSQIVDP